MPSWGSASTYQYDRAIELQAQERYLSEKIRDLEKAWEDSKGTTEPVVTEDEIAHIVFSWTGIPVSRLVETETARLLNMEQSLHERIIGQDEAIQAVSKAIRRTRSTQDPKRPMGRSSSSARPVSARPSWQGRSRSSCSRTRTT
jgi:ATP-dependent Clp protease ATP-binding subunit ClpC